MGITVKLTPGVDPGAPVLQARGSEQHVITDQEREAFGLSDAALKRAVGAFFGQEPSHAFLRGPTPWNDLYRTYGWPPVQSVLAARGAELLGREGAGVLKVRLRYELFLIGSVAVHYDPIYKGHRFWGLDIGSVMRAGGIPTHHTITEDVLLGDDFTQEEHHEEARDDCRLYRRSAGPGDGVGQLQEGLLRREGVRGQRR